MCTIHRMENMLALDKPVQEKIKAEIRKVESPLYNLCDLNDKHQWVAIPILGELKDRDVLKFDVPCGRKVVGGGLYFGRVCCCYSLKFEVSKKKGPSKVRFFWVPMVDHLRNGGYPPDGFTVKRCIGMNMTGDFCLFELNKINGDTLNKWYLGGKVGE